MVKSDTLNLRVSADFKRRLIEEARKEKRSVTNYLEATLTALWEKRDSAIKKNRGGNRPGPISSS